MRQARVRHPEQLTCLALVVALRVPALQIRDGRDIRPPQRLQSLALRLAQTTGQIEEFGRSDDLDSLAHAPAPERVFDLPNAGWLHARPQLAQDRAGQVFVEGSLGEEGTRQPQVQPHVVQVGRADAPPARQGGAEQHLRRQVLPYQGLPIGRDHEVLLGRRQLVRQRDKRAHQATAAAAGPAGGLHASPRPAVLALGTEKVMAAHEQGVGTDQFGPGRRIQRVRDADQRVAQYRRQFPANRQQAPGIALRSIHRPPQVEVSLPLDVAVDPVAARHGVGLFDGQHGPRKPDVRNALREAVGHGHVERLAARDALEVVGQVEQRIQRHQPLQNQELVHAGQHLAPRLLLALGGLAHQQVQQRRLRIGSVSPGCFQQRQHAGAPRFEHPLRIGRARGGREQGLHRRIGPFRRNRAVPAQHLPQRKLRLQDADGVGATQDVADLVQARHRVQVRGDGCLGEIGRVAVEGELVPVGRECPNHPPDSVG